jgi:hypothetical protein
MSEKRDLTQHVCAGTTAGKSSIWSVARSVVSGSRKANAKGRSTGKEPFVMLPHWAFDSRAYRSLKPGPRTLLWEFVRRHNGTNNGRIVFSQRDMARAISVTDRETVAGYVRELEAKGFVTAQRRGGFNVKVADRRASEWALSMFPISGEPATKGFMHWRPSNLDGTEKAAVQDGKSVPRAGDEAEPVSNVRVFPSQKARKARRTGTG